MSVECTSCGHPVPLGQFRCGKCGAVQTRDSVDDLAGLSELALNEPRLSPASQAEPEPEEPAPRDSLVPRGTFASDEPVPPDATTTGVELPERNSEPPARPQVSEPERSAQPAPVVAVARSEASQSHDLRAQQPAPRPPFLASEILHEDLMPAEPGREALTSTLRVFAILGLCVSAFSYQTAPFALISVGSLALLTLSFLRVPHITRATMVAGISGTGLCIACGWRLSRGGGLEDCLLAASTTLLASALLFRAWYRGSNIARGLVAASLLTCGAWALMSADRKLLSLDWTLQSWLPALVWCSFVLLCVLSLLAFMDDETTGACDIWAFSLLCWYAVQGAAREILPDNQPLDESLSTINLAEPVFTAPLAVALAQLFARALGQQHRAAQILLRRRSA